MEAGQQKNVNPQSGALSSVANQNVWSNGSKLSRNARRKRNLLLKEQNAGDALTRCDKANRSKQ